MGSATGIANLKISGDKVESKLTDAILLSVDVSQELNQHSWCTIVCRRSDQNPSDRMNPEECLATTLKISGYDQEGNEVSTQVWESILPASRKEPGIHVCGVSEYWRRPN
jgi:hypothetical protein